jgi:16S rRNA (uracil1498-N3)-methyltransferase
MGQLFSGLRTASKILLAERSDGISLSGLPLPASGDLYLRVGPEGGWKDEEVRQALAQGFTAATLGPRILRAETAALAAVTVVQSRLGALG